MVSQKGNAAVVAVGLAAKDFSTPNFSLMGLAGGLAILSAQLSGNHKEEKIAKIQGLALFSGLFLTVIFIIISLVFSSWNMRLFTADPTGVQYHRAIALGYRPVLITMVYSTVVRNAKIVKLPVYAGMRVVVLNALLNYLLIFGKFGMPALGIFGSELATTITQYVECICLLAVIFRKN